MLIFENAFILLFSNFVNITSKIPLSVSRIACAKMCLQGGNCSSFFYNHETKACLASTRRYYANTGLSRIQGYGYYMMRPDCDANWTVIAGQCYILRAEKLNFEDAGNKCKSFGGNLAKTDSLADDFIIGSFLQNGDTETCWIGGTDEANEGTWVWADGSPITLTRWGPRQPDNIRYYPFGYAEDCLKQSKQSWNDKLCSEKFSYLCEKYNKA